VGAHVFRNLFGYCFLDTNSKLLIGRKFFKIIWSRPGFLTVDEPVHFSKSWQRLLHDCNERLTIFGIVGKRMSTQAGRSEEGRGSSRQQFLLEEANDFFYVVIGKAVKLRYANATITFGRHRRSQNLRDNGSRVYS